MKLLRKDLDDTCTAILRRNEPKTQRSRIERLYRKQFDNEINRKGNRPIYSSMIIISVLNSNYFISFFADGALFRTIQITKKCIRYVLSRLCAQFSFTIT